MSPKIGIFALAVIAFGLTAALLRMALNISAPIADAAGLLIFSLVMYNALSPRLDPGRWVVLWTGVAVLAAMIEKGIRLFL